MGPRRMEYPLTHLGGDAFGYDHDPELPAFPSSAVLRVGTDGLAASLDVSGFEGTGFATLHRQR